MKASSRMSQKEKRSISLFWKDVRRYRYLLMMLLPGVIYTLLFSYLPMTGIVVAFKKFNYRDGIYGSPWNGLDNFKFLMISNKLWPLTRNTLLYNLAFIAFGMLFEVGFAILLNEIKNRTFKSGSKYNVPSLFHFLGCSSCHATGFF